jgi:hypothetical protein
MMKKSLTDVLEFCTGIAMLIVLILNVALKSWNTVIWICLAIIWFLIARNWRNFSMTIFKVSESSRLLNHELSKYINESLTKTVCKECGQPFIEVEDPVLKLKTGHIFQANCKHFRKTSKISVG